MNFLGSVEVLSANEPAAYAVLINPITLVFSAEDNWIICVVDLPLSPDTLAGTTFTLGTQAGAEQGQD